LKLPSIETDWFYFTWQPQAELVIKVHYRATAWRSGIRRSRRPSVP